MTLKLTADAAAAGAPKAASLLESSGLADYAAAYGIVNTELREKEEFRAARVHLQDSVVRRARAFAFANKIPAAEVRALFLHGSPVLRTRTAPAPHPHDRLPAGKRPSRRCRAGPRPELTALRRSHGGVRSGRRPRGVGL